PIFGAVTCSGGTGYLVHFNSGVVSGENNNRYISGLYTTGFAGGVNMGNGSGLVLHVNDSEFAGYYGCGTLPSVNVPLCNSGTTICSNITSLDGNIFSANNLGTNSAAVVVNGGLHISNSKFEDNNQLGHNTPNGIADIAVCNSNASDAASNDIGPGVVLAGGEGEAATFDPDWGIAICPSWMTKLGAFAPKTEVHGSQITNYSIFGTDSTNAPPNSVSYHDNSYHVGNSAALELGGVNFAWAYGPKAGAYPGLQSWDNLYLESDLAIGGNLECLYYGQGTTKYHWAECTQNVDDQAW